MTSGCVAVLGRSDKVPVFVPWHEIDLYNLAVDDVVTLWRGMDEYEHQLWADGRTLEQINWYHYKRREYRCHELMMGEYPRMPVKRLRHRAEPVCGQGLDRLASKDCVEPVLVGDIQADGQEGREAKVNIRLVKASNGRLKVWELPERRSAVKVRYLVVVDVGGRSESSDYSVIAVWRQPTPDRKRAIVAQWRGHIDHDVLAWKAMQLAKYYNDALLAVESNTLTNEAARAGESDFILEKVYQAYGNVYERAPGKLGFHTNVKTKRKAVAEAIMALRGWQSYTERDIEAVNEMRDYEEHNGRYAAARPGKHDDILMTRAIGLCIMSEPGSSGPWSTHSPDKSIIDDWVERGWPVSLVAATSCRLKGGVSLPMDLPLYKRYSI